MKVNQALLAVAMILAVTVIGEVKGRAAEDGNQALEEMGNDNFDLVICDVVMPQKDGWGVLSEMKSDPKTKDIPFILLTSKNENSDMFQGYGLGANYYMTKPFTKTQLLYALKLMFENAPSE